MEDVGQSRGRSSAFDKNRQANLAIRGMQKPGSNHSLTTKSPTNGRPNSLQLQAVDMRTPELERKHHPPKPPRRH
eukprot:556915-Amphidinium_carterae.4